jgi:pre-mRNA-splicing factor SPF27
LTQSLTIYSTDIDTEPTASQRSTAQSQIDAELALLHPSTLPSTHDNLPSPPAPNLTPLLVSELARIEAKLPIGGIDLSRYEALSDPSDDPIINDLSRSRDRLTQAHILQIYLSTRSTALSRLGDTGKEDWLSGNESLVSLLSGLEKELARTREEIDFCIVERRNAQEAVKGELEGLERGWKGGVGRVLETEVAAERLRRAILERRRRGGV